jgi:hypothetical protein
MNELAEDNAARVQTNSARAQSSDVGRGHWLTIFFVSAVLVIPCWWHSFLEAGDLGSRVYNAWLVQLIHRGLAPGLSLAIQRNNVLFDFLLGGLATIVSLNVGARIAASITVLVFSWGVFAFIRANTRRAPWFLLPMIAVVAYGWTFNRGIFNYYLSLGFAFFGLAIFCGRKGWMRLSMLAIVPFVWLAHPLGLVWMVAAALYIATAEIFPRRFHPLQVAGATGALAIANVYLRRHYQVEPPPHSVIFYNGLDQLFLTTRYGIPVLLLCAFFGVVLASEGLRSGIRRLVSECAIPLQLYLIVEAGVHLLPDAIRLPQYAAPLSDLTERFTSISAVLLCAILGAVQPRRWHLLAFTGVATLFFTLLYQDTATLNRMQRRTDLLVHTLPPGQRILLTINQPLKYRFSSKHILDLSCAGYCVSYGNYEAATGQFRIRARPGNAFVLSDIRDVSAVEAGSYVVKSRDLPLYQIYQCRSDWTDLCIRQLQAGETNGRLEVYSATR